MKPINKILTLLLSSSIIIANSQKIDLKEAVRNMQLCNRELHEYEGCIYDDKTFTKDNIDKLCSEYLSKKCKKFLKNPMKFLPACDLLPEQVKVSYQQLIDVSKPSMAFYCQKNENNERCPLVQREISGKMEDYDELMKAVQSTCKSKICKEAALNLYTFLNESIDDEEAILNEDKDAMENNKIIRDVYQALKSENCTVSTYENVKEEL